MLSHHAPDDDETSISTTAAKYMKIQHLRNSFDYNNSTSSNDLYSITILIYMLIVEYLLYP